MKCFLLASTIVVLIFACSKERVDPVQEKPQTVSGAQEEENDSTVLVTEDTLVEVVSEEFVEEDIVWKGVLDVRYSNAPHKTIKMAYSDSDLPIYGKQGTSFYPYASIFEDANGNDVDYPITLEFIELYTAKDMILANIPATSKGELLNSGGEFFVKAYKDGQEIFVKPFNNMTVKVPSADPEWDMEIFVNETNTDQFTDWVPADEATWVDPNTNKEAFLLWATDTVGLPGGATTPGYELSIASLGWINCDFFYSFTGGKTSVSFASAAIDLQYIQTYLYVPSASSVMTVYNGASGQIPVGEMLKVICFAVDSDDKTHYMIKEFTVEDGQTIEILLTEGAQTAFELELESL